MNDSMRIFDHKMTFWITTENFQYICADLIKKFLLPLKLIKNVSIQILLRVNERKKMKEESGNLKISD